MDWFHIGRFWVKLKANEPKSETRKKSEGRNPKCQGASLAVSRSQVCGPYTGSTSRDQPAILGLQPDAAGNRNS
jgi:hypothetical protein